MLSNNFSKISDNRWLCKYTETNQGSGVDGRDFRDWGILLCYRPPGWPMSTSPKRLSLATNIHTNRIAGQVDSNGEARWRGKCKNSTKMGKMLIHGTSFLDFSMPKFSIVQSAACDNDILLVELTCAMCRIKGFIVSFTRSCNGILSCARLIQVTSSHLNIHLSPILSPTPGLQNYLYFSSVLSKIL